MWEPRDPITKEIAWLKSLKKTTPKSIPYTSCAFRGVKWGRQKGWTYLASFPPVFMSLEQYLSLTASGTKMTILNYFASGGRRLQPEKRSILGLREVVSDVEAQMEPKFLPFDDLDNLDPIKPATLLSLAQRRYVIPPTHPDDDLVWRSDGRVLYIDGRLYGHLCLEDTCIVCQAY